MGIIYQTILCAQVSSAEAPVDRQLSLVDDPSRPSRLKGALKKLWACRLLHICLDCCKPSMSTALDTGWVHKDGGGSGKVDGYGLMEGQG